MEMSYKLPTGWKKTEVKHVAQIKKLVSDYLKNFEIHINFDEDEIQHWFIPIPNVISSFVLEDINGNVTDFGSYYHLNSNVLDKNNVLNAAYSFYNIQNSLDLKQIVKYLLMSAKLENFDVFNMLDIMDNNQVLSKLKFGKGTGELNYYMFNYSVKQPFAPSNIGIILM
jgi:glycylpeptide N-tetradecanoyltransferase